MDWQAITPLFLQHLPIIVAVGLALYGWRLLRKLARSRFSYDVCVSIISQLEQLEAESRQAWDAPTTVLARYAEERLAALTTGVETRIAILHNHYHKTRITNEDQRRLRQLATLPAEDIQPVPARDRELQSLVTKLITTLLEDNHTYINKIA